MGVGKEGVWWVWGGCEGGGCGVGVGTVGVGMVHTPNYLVFLLIL